MTVQDRAFGGTGPAAGGNGVGLGVGLGLGLGEAGDDRDTPTIWIDSTICRISDMTDSVGASSDNAAMTRRAPSTSRIQASLCRAVGIGDPEKQSNHWSTAEYLRYLPRYPSIVMYALSEISICGTSSARYVTRSSKLGPSFGSVVSGQPSQGCPTMLNSRWAFQSDSPQGPPTVQP